MSIVPPKSERLISLKPLPPRTGAANSIDISSLRFLLILWQETSNQLRQFLGIAGQHHNCCMKSALQPHKCLPERNSIHLRSHSNLKAVYESRRQVGAFWIDISC